MPNRMRPCAGPSATTRRPRTPIAFALVQAAARHVHRGQAGRTRGVHRQRRAVHAQCVGDPPRRHAEVVAQKAVRPLQRVGVGGYRRVVVVRHAHEDTGARTRQCGPGQTTVLHGFPRRLQQQSLLRVRRDRLALTDPEELAVEVGVVVDEGAPLTYRPARHARFRGRRTSASQRSSGITVIMSSPRSNASHSCSGESIPPGNRHAKPMTATGVTRGSSTTRSPLLSNFKVHITVTGQSQELYEHRANSLPAGNTWNFPQLAPITVPRIEAKLFVARYVPYRFIWTDVPEPCERTKKFQGVCWAGRPGCVKHD